MSQTPGSGEPMLNASTVTVHSEDLLHCLQVAVWRAGVIDQGTLRRLKNALGLDEDELVPKPPPRHG